MTPGRAQELNASVVTERLVLEPMTAAHADPLFAPMQDERIYHWISPSLPDTIENLRSRWAMSRGAPFAEQRRSLAELGGAAGQ
jgi:hypothetical protein